MSDDPHILLSEVPAVRPRRANRDPWQEASDRQSGWRLVRETVKITRIIQFGDRFRIELSTDDHYSANAEHLADPASVARNVEQITGKPLGVPAGIESIAGWIPYINSLIQLPEAENV